MIEIWQTKVRLFFSQTIRFVKFTLDFNFFEENNPKKSIVPLSAIFFCHDPYVFYKFSLNSRSLSKFLLIKLISCKFFQHSRYLIYIRKFRYSVAQFFNRMARKIYFKRIEGCQSIKLGPPRAKHLKEYRQQIVCIYPTFRIKLLQKYIKKFIMVYLIGWYLYYSWLKSKIGYSSSNIFLF